MKNPTITNEAIQFIITENEDVNTSIIPAIEIENHDVFAIMEKSGKLKWELTLADSCINNKASNFEKLMFCLKCSMCEQDFRNIAEKIALSMFTDYVKFGSAFVVDALEGNEPVDDYAFKAGFKVSNVILSKLEARLAIKRSEVIKHISIDTNHKNISTVYMAIDENLVDNINAIDGIKIIAFGTGRGKTKFYTKPSFDKSCNDGLTPIGISPKRILAAMICGDKRNYRNITGSEEIIQPGLFGVVNSVAGSSRYSKYKTASLHLIAEEHEEIKGQCAGKAVKSGKLLERAELLESYYGLINDTANVVLIDAMFSTSEADKLADITGRKITIIREMDAPTKEGKTINFITESENISRANLKLKNGKNVIAFNDGSNKGEKSKFNENFHAMANNAKSSMMVTANTVSELENEVEFISNIEAELSKVQFAMLSPVVNSGVSIEGDHFSGAHLFLNQVQSVKSSIQTLDRVRAAKNIDLSMVANMSPKITSAEAIIAHEMYSDVEGKELSQELFDAYKSNKSVKMVADIIAEENKMRVDYEVSMIIACRHLGYKITFNANKSENGAEQSKIGREIETAIRVEQLIEAESISSDEADIIEEENYITNKNKIKLAAYEMKKFYQVGILDEALITFDSKGETRRVIDNNLMAISDLGEKASSKTVIKKAVIDCLFDSIGIDAKNLNGVYSKDQAQSFVNKIKSGSFKIGEMDIDGAQAFRVAFGKSMDKGHASTIISKLLSSKFGIKIMSAGQVKRVNTYTVDKESMNEDLMAMVAKLSK